MTKLIDILEYKHAIDEEEMQLYANCSRLMTVEDTDSLINDLLEYDSETSWLDEDTEEYRIYHNASLLIRNELKRRYTGDKEYELHYTLVGLGFNRIRVFKTIDEVLDYMDTHGDDTQVFTKVCERTVVKRDIDIEACRQRREEGNE